MPSFRYRAGYRGAKSLQPEAVKAELDRIAAEDALTAARVVEAATPEDAPLHPEFPWDDSQAAHLYRLEVARTLIRAVVIVPDPVEGQQNLPEPRSVYVHVPDQEAHTEGRYVELSTVIDDDADYERALAEAMRYLRSARQRFEELRELAAKRGGKTEALTIAVQGFAAVQEALSLLKVA